MSGKYRRKRSPLIPLLVLVLGAALLVAALTMSLSKSRKEAEAAQAVERAQAALEAAAHQAGALETAPTTATEATTSATDDPTLATTEATDPTDPPTLTSELLDGHEYVGYLSFPSLERKLPVMKIKYLEDLQIAPCLEKGSPHTDDAVISAHNYPAHFGPIRDWEGGEEVIFTDLQDNSIHYTVSLVETISPYDVDKVMESDHDLVLYTCTPGGANRVMIACDRTET